MADGSQLMVGAEVGRGKRATAAFWLGIASLVTWLVPTVGLPVSGVGLVLAVKARREGAERARLAVVLCVIGVALSLTMWVGSAAVIDRVAR